MRGQWFGNVEGEEGTGFGLIDLDDRGDHYSGSGFYFDYDETLPGTYAHIRTPDKATRQELSLTIAPLNRDGVLLSDDEMKAQYPEAMFSRSAELILEQQGDQLQVRFRTGEPVNTLAAGTLKSAPPEDQTSVLVDPDVGDWQSFKRVVGEIRPRRFIFRGQGCIKRLRTTFHRTSRTDLVRFIGEDRYELFRAASPLTRHFYDLSDPVQTGAFYSLMQHHGYPTPFLDWSWSPFIAAFFAFRRPITNTDKVRIFMLDLPAWEQVVPRRQALTFVPPHAWSSAGQDKGFSLRSTCL